MKTLISSLLCAMVCLTFVSGTRGQTYLWKITHPGMSGPITYSFTSIDSWGEVITVAGVRKNDTLQTGDRNALIFCRSTDGGETWTEQDAGLPHFGRDAEFSFQKIQQIDSLNVVAILDSTLIRTTDGGTTWLKQTLPSSGRLFDVDFSDSITGIVTATNSSDIMTTTDAGSHWQIAPFHPYSIGTQCHAFQNGHFLVSINNGSSVYKTTDHWETYDSLSPIIPANDKSDLIGWSCWRFLGEDTIVAFGSHDTSGAFLALIMKSTDGGNSWTRTNVDNSIVTSLRSMSFLDRDIVFCSGGSQNPYLLSSTDHGMSWRIDTMAIDTIFPYVIAGVTVTPNGRAVAIYGLFQTALVTGMPESDAVSEPPTQSPHLSMYPNPATGSITITSLPARQSVEVLDILGREVLQGTTPANGSLTLDISSLSPGVYYVSEGQTEIRFIKN